MRMKITAAAGTGYPALVVKNGNRRNAIIRKPREKRGFLYGYILNGYA